MSRRIWNKGEKRRVFAFWRWPSRLCCHLSIMPCQYKDDPNDNRRARTW